MRCRSMTSGRRSGRCSGPKRVIAPASRPRPLEQVWFAGVHAKVGGGYPDDGLADFHARLDDGQGRTLAISARRPARVGRPCQPRGQRTQVALGSCRLLSLRAAQRRAPVRRHAIGVSIETAKIHRGAIDRIAAASRLRAGQPPAEGSDRGRESPSAGASAAKDWMESGLDKVWWRRVGVFRHVLISAILALFAFFEMPDWLDKTIGTSRGGSAHGAAKRLPTAWRSRRLGRELPGDDRREKPRDVDLRAFPRAAPGWTKFWLEAFKDYPVTVGILALILAWLVLLPGARCRRRSARRAEYAWADCKRIRPSRRRTAIRDHIARFMRKYVTSADALRHAADRPDLVRAVHMASCSSPTVVITFPLSI